jgi:Tfp pilus assembly protein PilF
MAEAHVNVGLILQQQGKVQEALTCYQKAVDIVPTMITAWINMTSVYTMLEEDDKAVESARQAISIEATSGLARNNLAVALYFKGEYKEAKEQLDRAKEYGYSVDSRFSHALDMQLA